MSTPSIRIAPELGFSSRATQRARVLLPEPDSPTSATISPRLIVRSTPCRARTDSRENSPPMGNDLPKPRISRAGVLVVESATGDVKEWLIVRLLPGLRNRSLKRRHQPGPQN